MFVSAACSPRRRVVSATAAGGAGGQGDAATASTARPMRACAVAALDSGACPSPEPRLRPRRGARDKATDISRAPAAQPTHAASAPAAPVSTGRTLGRQDRRRTLPRSGECDRVAFASSPRARRAARGHTRRCAAHPPGRRASTVRLGVCAPRGGELIVERCWPSTSFQLPSLRPHLSPRLPPPLASAAALDAFVHRARVQSALSPDAAGRWGGGALGAPAALRHARARRIDAPRVPKPPCACASRTSDA